MAEVDEVQQAKQWLYETLLSDSDIADGVAQRIYADYAPESLASRVFPYILFNFIAGTDVDGLGTARIFAMPLFQVRVVFEGRATDEYLLIAKRVDDVLQNAVNEPSGDYYFTCRREQPIDRSEVDPATNRHFGNIGGLYRLWIGASV